MALRNGEHAHDLIGRLVRRLVDLQAPVLEDSDPEPLHQMRVSMRRLRTCLRQFGPALEMPARVTDRRIGRVGRRLGMARDLDVLRDLLRQELLPALPEEERERLRPVLRQLRRERRHAYGELVKTLRSGAYLGMLAHLQRWLKKPRFTALGEAPLGDWLVEWQAPLLVAIFTHPGWFVADLEGDLEQVHDLRKQCKSARYSLENLAAFGAPCCRDWAGRFKGLQQLLGDLNDLQVLGRAIEDQLPGSLAAGLPGLHDRLQERTRDCWSEWRQEATALLRPALRHRLLEDLLGEPEAGPPVEEPAPETGQGALLAPLPGAG
jgi:CHAD domain-containing protein